MILIERIPIIPITFPPPLGQRWEPPEGMEFKIRVLRLADNPFLLYLCMNVFV